MEEEADAVVQTHGAQLRGHVHEVIVLHPHHVIRSDAPADDLGETPVHGLVAVPVGGLENAVGEEIVEQRPDHLIGEPAVEVVHLLRRERHRQRNGRRRPR